MVFPFLFLSRNKYNRLLSEHRETEKTNKILQEKNGLLEQALDRSGLELKEKEELLAEKATQLQKANQKLEASSEQCKEMEEKLDRLVEKAVGDSLKDIGMDTAQIEKLQLDREELIELYRDKLYSLAKLFACASRDMQKNRGLFLVLADRHNMAGNNFSEFHDGQLEHLGDNRYSGIENSPHIFSSKIGEVLTYMGEKMIVKDETGKITGHEERDGALMVDLCGLAFRSCLMVEGVRTHRTYEKVEKLYKGSARHNAAIYASSLEEVLASIVVSEETSEVTLFIDGLLLKRYDPHTDSETSRKPTRTTDHRTETSENENTSDNPEGALTYLPVLRKNNDL